MAGKNTAVFGIYTTVAQAERAVDALVLARFSNSDVSVLMPDNQARRTSHTRNTPRHPKAPQPASRPAAPSAARSACLLELAPWPFPALVHSSPRGRSWALWPGSA